MPYATLSDVGIDFDNISTVDPEKVETLLDRAEDRVRQVFPDLDARVADGRTTVIRVKQVESEMVAAVLRNPNAVRTTSVNEAIGPFSKQTQSAWDNVVASGLLELTARHREMLGERVYRGPFSIPLSL